MRGDYTYRALASPAGRAAANVAAAAPRLRCVVAAVCVCVCLSVCLMLIC